jgi:hypothetical protein
MISGVSNIIIPVDDQEPRSLPFSSPSTRAPSSWAALA